MKEQGHFLILVFGPQLILLRIWKPCAHRQTAVPKFSYLDKYVFLVMVPYLCLMGITCVRCGVSFTTNLLHFTHRRHCPRVFDHVRGRRFPAPQIETLPRKAGVCPLSNHATEGDFPTTPRPMGLRLPQRATFPQHPGQ